MELFESFKRIIDTNIILCLIPIIITLALINLFFKQKYPTKKALNFTGWIIIIYTAATLIHFIFGIIFYSNEYTFIERATGPYKLVYWLMLLSSTLFPFSLLFKKLRTKFWYILLVSFFMKIGMYFEQFVIITTSIHRDYSSEKGLNNNIKDFFFNLGIIYFQGFVMAILMLIIIKVIEKRQLRTTAVL
ncbi:hypothetical protein [Flavobacterium suncheonense]|uniref:Uncharacterized protein n=1 Tax=Flavobacterium suncheonense GH29-5 = DSM 17707 TaxID=1121899 RepID=A0A0A2M255_9FLAO|nr:hypothetical protein [Flavobacterium suncheonense]KGO86692.1 hypothetical protein Q764_13560 [Flavobacterium suncheonense GH29-5 = DSM 17707]